MSKLSFLSVATLFRRSEHQRILMLAIPMILANITTPLIGLVDTAVLGHMPQVHFLAGAAIGAFILTQLYWICGFVRMTTTGLSAQAKGQDNKANSAASHSCKVLKQSLLVSLGIGLVILLGQHGILSLGHLASEPSEAVAAALNDYFLVRVWGAPFVMMNMSLVGWLIGQQLPRHVMWIQISTNLLNVLLNLLFVFVFEWGVAGVALASVVAEVSAFFAAFVIATRQLSVSLLTFLLSPAGKLARFIRLNSHMLVRNLALQLCLAFITFQGARLGEQTAALNAIIMQFFVLIALGLDGVAYAIEALLGEAKGERQHHKIIAWVKLGVFWSSLFALAYSVIFWLFGGQILLLLTDKEMLYHAFNDYLPIVLLLPLIGHWCFLFDAVFVGLTRAKAMQNSMLVSCLLVFFPVWWWFSSLQNVALWLAMLAFLAARGFTLGGYFIYLQKKVALLD